MKYVLIGALAAALALIGAGPVAAQPAPPGIRERSISGAPAVGPWSPAGYYLWRDGARVHLRTTDGGGDASEYSGRIQSNGRVHAVDVVRPEAADGVIAGRDTLWFHFRTDGHVDGVSFDVSGADWLSFRLERNGHLIATDRIFLGGAGLHPPGNPFAILR
jgi:hypothetical protein